MKTEKVQSMESPEIESLEFFKMIVDVILLTFELQQTYLGEIKLRYLFIFSNDGCGFLDLQLCFF